jgi:hypothetical protein
MSFLMSLVSETASIAAEDSKLPEDLRVLFKTNTDLLNPIEITWKRTRHSRLAEDELMDQIGLPRYAKHDFFAEFLTTYKWQDGMAYELILGSIADRIPKAPSDPVKTVPFGAECSFDGERIYMGTPEQTRVKIGKQPTLKIDSLADPKFAQPLQKLFKSTYLSTAGYWMPSVIGELGHPAKHIVLYLLNNGAELISARSVSSQNTELFEVKLEETDLVHVFLFDPEKGYAMRQHKEIVKASGQIARIIDCANFQKAREPSLWLPNVCHINHFTWETVFPKCTAEPIVVETLELVSLKTSPIPQNEFVLTYTTPGTFVGDSTLPEARNSLGGVVGYRISANPDTLKDGINAARQQLDGSFAARRWLIILNLIVIILLVGGLLWRRFG